LGIHAEKSRIDLAETMAWKDGVVRALSTGVEHLLAKAGVRRIQGWGRILDGKTVVIETTNPDTSETTVHAKQLILATGSRPIELKELPFSGRVISSTEALALRVVPKHLVVIGGGYIGLELGMAFAKLGAKVTLIEASEQLLPSFDAEIVRPVVRRAKRLGITIHTSSVATNFDTSAGIVKVQSGDGSMLEVPADYVLVTVGRTPSVEGWGLEGLDLDRDGPFVRIDQQCRTSMTGVFAVGDLTGEPMLAHRAIAQGRLAAEVIGGHRRIWDKRSIPAVVFTDPEIVSVGVTPEEAARIGVATVLGKFPYSASGRALSMADTDGFVRIVARESDHLVIGLQGVGAGIAELSTSFSLALEMGAHLEDIADTIHAHPTRGEAVQEAALQALGMPMHLA
jgi:dihydrolipoamide dehydrogenase